MRETMNEKRKRQKKKKEKRRAHQNALNGEHQIVLKKCGRKILNFINLQYFSKKF